MLLISSQSIYAGVGDGSGAEPGVGDGSGAQPGLLAGIMQFCTGLNSDMEKQKVWQMCEVINTTESSSDGTGAPSTEDGTGAPSSDDGTGRPM